MARKPDDALAPFFKEFFTEECMRFATLFFCLIFVGCSSGLLRALTPKATIDDVDTLVLCPAKFQESIKRWVDYRIGQGHKIKVEAPRATAAAIKTQISELASNNKQSFKNVFIVGDSGDRRSGANDLVKTDIVTAKVNVHFGSDPEIATDNTYADLNNDGVPELTIGRLPADSVEEVKQFTDRVIAYESESNTGPWRRRVNCVAGVGGFGQMIDGLIENTTKQILTDLVPSGYETSMTYGSWRSPYCPDPRRFSFETIERFNEGCMFWLYIGHGNRHWLDQIRLPDQRHNILDNESVSKIDCREGNPIAIFLSCYTGDCNHPVDCLAENLLKQKNGPIGVICGTRITMPYAMSLLSLEMVHEFFNGEAKTLGELTRIAKVRMVLGSDNNPEYRQMIEGMGQAFSPKRNLLKQERLEHVQLIHLVGDPLLRLQRPTKVEVVAPDSSVAGDVLTVDGVVPADGTLILELAYQRDRLKKRMKRRKEYDSSDASFANYQETYTAARDLVCTSKEIEVSAGKFQVKLDVPADSSGRCVVRAMLVSENGFALGSSLIDIKKR